MATATGGVFLGSAHGDIQIDTSQVKNQLNKAFRNAEQQAGNALSRVGTSIQNMGNSIADVGTKLTTWTAPLAAVGGYGLKVYGKFDDAMAEIEARTGATADEMERVRDVAMQMGQETSYSATEAAEGMLQLLSSGYDLEQTFAALPAVLDAAAAGGMDLGYTADVVTDALAMFGLEADDAERVANALAAGAAASSAEMNDLAQGLGNVGPIANQFGLGIEDTVAILAAFSENGIKGAEAGTQLKSMLTNMTRDVPKVKKKWAELGVSLYDAQGNLRPLENIFAELGAVTAQMSEQDRIEAIQTIFGSYGQLGGILLSQTDAWGQMNRLMGDQADASTVAEARLNTLGGAFGQVKSSLDTFLITGMGPAIEKYIKPFLQQVAQVINRMTEWAAKNPAVTTAIMGVVGALIALGPILFVVGKAVAIVGGAIALLASPLGIAITAVGLLAAAFDVSFGDVKDAIEAVGDWIKEKGGPAIVDFIGDDAIPALNDLREKLLELWDKARPKLEALKLWFMTTGFSNIMDFINNTARPGLGLLISALIKTWTDVRPFLEKLYGWFKRVGMPAIVSFINSTVIPAIGRLIGKISGIWNNTWRNLHAFVEFVKLSIGWLIPNVFNPLGEAIQKVIDFLGDLRDEINKISIPSWLSDGIGSVGDALGFSASSSSSATPMGGAAGAFGSGGSTAITVHIGETVLERHPDAEAYGRDLAAELTQRLRWSGTGSLNG